MARTGRTVAGAVVTVGLLTFSTFAGAQAAADQQAALHRRTEKRIARLHDKVALAQPQGPIAAAHLKVADRLLDMADKVHSVGNDPVARLLADQADHMLELAASAKEVQP